MSSMSVFGMLVWCGAAVSLWLGARGHSSAVARGYRWLALAALGWCAGLVIQQLIGGTVSPGTGLSLADLPPLLAVAGAAVGIGVLTTAEREPAETTVPRAGPQSPDGTATLSVLPGLMDGYVMAVALLVIGWVTLFSSEFHHSGDRPGTFLLALIHPLADLAVLGALLPLVTTAWQRVVLPYLSLLAVAVGDALAIGGRVSGGHLGLAAQLMAVIAAVLLGLAPWRMAEMPGSRWINRTSASAGATIIAALAASAATLVVIGYCLAGVATYGVALVIAGGAGVLVLAARVFMLVGQNGMVLRIWRESSRNLRDLANRTSDVVLICDLVGVIGYASPAAADFGYPPRDLVGRRLLDFVHPEDRLAALAAFRRALSDHAAAESAPAAGAHGGAAESSEPPPVAGRLPVRIRTADGTWRYVESTVLPYQVPGQDGQLLVTARDVSDQVALRQQVTHLTFHDGLTGLPNRSYLEERTKDLVTRLPSQPGAAGGSDRAAAIFVDLDGFTAINDSVGHGAGDLLLAQAGRRLRGLVPAHDTVARWGGDEFAILVEQAASPQEIVDIAERLAGAIAAAPFQVADRDVTITASLGVAFADSDVAEHLLRNADLAMARAKEAGGGRVEVFAAHMHADVIRRLELATDLRQAITDGALELEYQPLVELATARIAGVEALVRWSRGGVAVSPAEFLSVAEESGLIIPLGEWVLQESCAQVARWRDSGWNVGLSVNFSHRQVSTARFAESVLATLDDSGLPRSALTLEVTERVLIETSESMIDELARLRQLGIRLAIDDFGTGYASLAYLRELPVDIIKIDPSFVAGLGTDGTLAMLARTVVQVGHDLGIEIVAEGIERPEQLELLRAMGCGLGQGYLVARPTPAEGLEALSPQYTVKL